MMSSQDKRKMQKLEIQNSYLEEKFEEARQDALNLVEAVGGAPAVPAACSPPAPFDDAAAEFEKTRREAINDIRPNRTIINICCYDIHKLLTGKEGEYHLAETWKQAVDTIADLNGSPLLIFVNQTLPEGLGADFLHVIRDLKAHKILVLNESTMSPEVMDLCISSSCKPWVRPIDMIKFERLFTD